MLRDKDMTAGDIASRFRDVLALRLSSPRSPAQGRPHRFHKRKGNTCLYYSINTTVLDDMFQWLLQFKIKRK